MEKAGLRVYGIWRQALKLGLILYALFTAGSHPAASDAPLPDALSVQTEAVRAVEAAPAIPSPVAPENRVSDPMTLCPGDAVWYMAVPDSVRMRNDWQSTPARELADSAAIVRMFRNNRFGLGFLFSDLPSSIITQERVNAVAGTLELAQSLAGISNAMATACYIGPDGDFQFLFLFDIGLNREPAFTMMKGWETSFLVSNPDAGVRVGSHSGNYLDAWTLQTREKRSRPAEIAAGFAENMAVVSNSSALAASSLKLLSGGESLADSRWGGRLAASVSGSAAADAAGFVRMDALLEGLNATPIARNSVLELADLIGDGGESGEAVYYGLRFAGDGSGETFLLPDSGSGAPSSLLDLVGRRLRPAANGWASPSVIPYQPNPSLYVAAMLDGRELGGWLRQDRRLFGRSPNASFDIPETVRPVFTNEVVANLTGEIGVAFFARQSGGDWLTVLPATGNPEPLLARAASMVERSGATIRSAGEDWRNSPAWMAASPASFRRLTENFLLIASRGEVLIAVCDQLAAGASFAANRDFIHAMSQAEPDQGLVFYLNLPEILGREYPNLSQIARSAYPRSSGLNSRPPLTLLRRYAKGFLGAIASAGDDGGFTRLTIRSPLPSLGAAAVGVALRFPMSLRADGRAAMAKSRENMQGLWLQLQLFSSRFGHFPDSLADLAAAMRLTMPEDEINSLMTAPAALSTLPPSRAAMDSYRFLSGVTPADEPDIPLVYEARAWSEDFAGMYPVEPNRSPSERGDFQRYRQYIRLDGALVTVSESYFVDKIMPRLAERE